MKTCEALITSVPKHGKAWSVRPTDTIIYSETDQELPKCGGQISFEVTLTGDGPCCFDEYCYCEYPEIHVNATCTNCRRPWCPGIEQLVDKDPTNEIERLLNV